MPICPQGCRPLPLTLLAWAGGASKQPTAATTHRSFMPVILGARRPDTCERTRGQTGPVAAASPGMGGGWAPGFQGLLDLAPNAAIPPSPQCWGARKKEGVSRGPDPRSGPLIPRPEAHSPLRPLRPHETWGAESGSSGPTAKQARPHPRPGVTRGPSGPSRSRTPPPLPASHLPAPRWPRETRLAPPLQASIGCHHSPSAGGAVVQATRPAFAWVRGLRARDSRHFPTRSRREKRASAFQTGDRRGPALVGPSRSSPWTPGL